MFILRSSKSLVNRRPKAGCLAYISICDVRAEKPQSGSRMVAPRLLRNDRLLQTDDFFLARLVVAEGPSLNSLRSDPNGEALRTMGLEWLSQFVADCDRQRLILDKARTRRDVVLWSRAAPQGARNGSADLLGLEVAGDPASTVEASGLVSTGSGRQRVANPRCQARASPLRELTSRSTTRFPQPPEWRDSLRSER